MRRAMDPRIARTHEAVMKAATDLLVEGGPDALTVDGVVARSGVAKSTVYRHWATRDELVADVLTSCAPHLEPVVDAGDFAEAISQLMRSFLDAMNDEHWNRVLPSLLILKTELRAMEELNRQITEEQAGVVADVLRRGVDEGVLRASVLDDIDLAVTLLAGPVLMAGLTGMVPLDEAFGQRVVEQFLAGAAAPVAVHR